MPEFQTFLDQNNMDTLIENSRWLLFFVAPVVMLFVGLAVLGLFIDMFKSIFKKANDDDEDDDYDVYRY